MSPTHWKLVAIVTGVLLAGLPVLAANLWFNGFVERQDKEEVEQSTRRTIALSETRITRTLDMLNDLAGNGVDSCRAASQEAMRHATFSITAIKEISIVAPDGRTICTDVGSSFEPRTVVSSERLTPDGDVLIEMVRVGDRGAPMVRIHRPNGTANGLAALIPADQFIAQVSSQGGPLSAHVRMVTRAGTVIGEGGVMPKASEAPKERVTATLTSQRYGLTAAISLPRGSIGASHGDLRIAGLVITGGIAVGLIGLFAAFSFFAPKPERDNPIVEIERAMKAGEFVPYYQPIVDIRSGKLRGAEVLMRWRKPDGTIISPAAFIPLAESSGLIVDLTRALMRKVRDEAGSAFGRRPHLKFGFNLTAQHFSDEQIVRDVTKIFGESPIRLTQLVLEVTERHPIDNLTETRRVIAALQGIGVRIAIDDVGTGHSGLSYMLKLGVDIIKIDKMFIDSIGTDRNSNTIIETLIDLARNMRMDVVAEGVEHFEQVVHLREIGIRAAQGFVFAPPLPGTAFLQLLEAIDPLKGTEEQSKVADAKRPLSRFASRAALG